MVFKGIGAAPGLAVEKCLLIEDVPIKDYSNDMIDEGLQTEHWATVQGAVTKASDQIEKIKQKAIAEGYEDRAEIMEAHQMILADPMLASEFENKIKANASAY